MSSDAQTRRVLVRRLPGCVSLPTYESDGAAGMDVYAAEPVNGHPWCIVRSSGVETCDGNRAATLYPGDRARIPSGVAVAVPLGWELQVRPRSGLAWRKGVTVTNSPGTIDSDYRGAVDVLVINHGHEPLTISPGDRIAQLVLCPVVQAQFEEVGTLPDTERGAGGFGSTGGTQ